MSHNESIVEDAALEWFGELSPQESLRRRRVVGRFSCSKFSNNCHRRQILRHPALQPFRHHRTMSLNESIVEDAALEWFGEHRICAPNSKRSMKGELESEPENKRPPQCGGPTLSAAWQMRCEKDTCYAGTGSSPSPRINWIIWHEDGYIP